MTEKTEKLNGFHIEPLATKLSAILRQAVGDLIAVEVDEAYRVNMATWHDPEYQYDDYGERSVDPSEPCEVCLAGAWLARRSDVPPAVEIDPFQQETDSGNLQAYLVVNAHTTREELRNPIASRTARIMLTLDAMRNDSPYAVEVFGRAPSQRLVGELQTIDSRYESENYYGRPVTYDEDPSLFKERLGKIADCLEKHGL